MIGFAHRYFWGVKNSLAYHEKLSITIWFLPFQEQQAKDKVSTLKKREKNGVRVVAASVKAIRPVVLQNLRSNIERDRII